MDIARELKKSNKQCPPDTKEKRNVQPIRYGWVVYLEVRPERLELPTFCSEDKRSVQLSYGRRSERNYSPKNNEPTVLKWLGRS